MKLLFISMFVVWTGFFVGTNGSVEVCIIVKASHCKEPTLSKKQLRPDAPAFVPFQKILEKLLLYQQLHAADKEPQCSRYSRKSIRVSLDANTSPATHDQQENVNPDSQSNPASPRPILGNAKTVSPRAILGRKENLMPSKSVVDVNVKQQQQKIVKDDERKQPKKEAKKEQDNQDDEDDDLANMGKEYRSVYRRIQRLKMSDDAANKKTISNINVAIVSNKKKCPVSKS